MAATSPAQVSSCEASSSSSSRQTILRIKRKRNQDPIDALIIQQNERRQKRRSIVLPDAGPSTSDADPTADAKASSRGVFRLAETVSLASFSNPTEAQRLHSRITALAGKGRSRPSVPSKLSQSLYLPATESLLASDDPKEEDDLSRSTASLGASGRSTPLNRATDRIKALASDQIDRQKDRQSRGRSSTPTGMRYRVIQKDAARSLHRSGSSASLRKGQGHVAPIQPWQVEARPPEIRSKREKEAEAIFGKIIDAEADSAKQTTRRTKKPSESKNENVEMEGLDSKFAELLGDYLRSNDIEPSQELDKLTDQPDPHGATNSSASTSDVSDSEEEEYVYDIYYRDLIPSWTAGSAETGLQPAIVPGHEKQHTGALLPDSMAMPRIVGGDVVPPEATAVTDPIVAQLEGFDDSDEEMEAAAAEDGGFESFDEGEDEDSNDEGFYRNDYPEQELPDEELEYEFGSDSDDSQDVDRYALSDTGY